MNESEQLGFVTSVIEQLNEAGSWTGRMHIQKLIYFIQTLLEFDAGYEFILYQRGPYSFELDEDIRTLRSIGAVDIKPLPPYGPTYFTTSAGDTIAMRNSIDADTFQSIRWLAEELGPKPAKELELLATTLYAEEEGYALTEAVVERVSSLKPQFDRDEITSAISELGSVKQSLNVA